MPDRLSHPAITKPRQNERMRKALEQLAEAHLALADTARRGFRYASAQPRPAFLRKSWIRVRWPDGAELAVLLMIRNAGPLQSAINDAVRAWHRANKALPGDCRCMSPQLCARNDICGGLDRREEFLAVILPAKLLQRTCLRESPSGL